MSAIFTYYCLILFWLIMILDSNFKKKAGEFQALLRFSELTIFHIACYKLAEFRSRIIYFVPKFLLRIPLKVIFRHIYENCCHSRDICKDIWGSKWPHPVWVLTIEQHSLDISNVKNKPNHLGKGEWGEVVSARSYGREKILCQKEHCCNILVDWIQVKTMKMSWGLCL